jgi:signal transduction histidine kinase
MKRLARVSARERNRDAFIARIADGFGRTALELARAERLPPAQRRAALARIVSHLRESAREIRWIGTGKVDGPLRKRVDVVAVVRQAADRWKTPLRRRGCRLRVEAEPKVILGGWDREHLEAIIGELLSNAGKHGAEAPVIIGVRANERVVTISIENGGRGSPLPRRPFLRFSRGPRTRGFGMGVGLWLTDAIARRNGGTLTFVRTESGGVRAVVRLARA